MTRFFLLLVLTVAAFACGSGGTTVQPTAPSATATRPPASGPRASVQPRSVPPGAQVTVSGDGWPAGALLVITGEAGPGAETRPYATTTVSGEGTFSVSFAIEKTAAGEDLKVGPYNLIAMAPGAQVMVPVQVETRRPLTPGDRLSGG